jgi:ankyrin repeat protein
MAEEVAAIDFDALKPKNLVKLWKSVVKEVKAKDVDEKLKAISKVVNEPRYLLEGGAVVPFIESYTNKKKMLDYTKEALPYLIQYLETPEKVVGASPGRAAIDALMRISAANDLSSLKNLVALTCYAETVKKPKKGQVVEVNTEMQDYLKFHSVKAVAAFARDVLSPDTGLEVKKAFATIPDFMTSLSTALAHLMGRLAASEELAEGEEPVSEDFKAALVVEGVNVLTCIAATIEHCSESMEICVSSGVVASALQLLKRPEFSLACLQVLKRVSADAAGLHEVASVDALATILACLKATSEAILSATEGDEGLRTLVCCLGELQAIFTDVGARVGGALSAETMTAVVENVSTCVLLPHVWATMRDTSVERPTVVITKLCDATGVLMATLGGVSPEACISAMTAGACRTLVALFLASGDVSGWMAGKGEAGDEDAAAANAAARLRTLELRRSLEKAILMLTSSAAAEEPRTARRWASCDRYVTVEALFNIPVVEEGEDAPLPLVPVSDVAVALSSDDRDLAVRATRMLTAMTLGSADPLAFATAQGLGVEQVNSLSAMVSLFAQELLATTTSVEETPAGEGTAESGSEGQEKELPTKPETEPSPPTPPALPVDRLIANGEESFCLALALLEVLLRGSADAVAAFTDEERFAVLRPLLFASGPTASAAAVAEVKVSGYDPRDYSWVPVDSEEVTSVFVLRALILDVMSIVVGAAAAYRTFEGAVPAAAGNPLPACESPSAEGANSASRVFVDCAAAVLLCETRFVTAGEGDGGLITLVQQASERVVDATVVNAALGFIACVTSGSVSCLTAGLEGMAATTFVEEADYSAANSASGPLISVLQAAAAAAPVENGEDARSVFGTQDWVGVVLFDTVFGSSSLLATFSTDGLLACPALWPYISLCAGVVGVLQKPSMGTQSMGLASKTVMGLCRDTLFEDFIQPAVNDVCGAVSVALGGLTACISNVGRFGQLVGDAEMMTFCTYLATRGQCRELQWATAEEEGMETAVLVPGHLPCVPDGSHPDPNHGPTKAAWGDLLRVKVNDAHSHTSSLGPLSCSIINYFPDISLALIEGGADVNETDGAGVTALMYALALGEEETVGVLLGANANRNAMDMNGVPVSRYATSTISKEVLCGATAGHMDAPSGEVVALRSGSPLLEALLNAGFDVDERDHEGNGVILYVLGVGALELSIGGYSLYVRNRAYSEGQETSERVALMQMLMTAGCNTNACNKEGMAPVHKAAAQGDADVVKLLVSNGASPNLQDSLGFTPMHFVCAVCPEGATATMDVLLASGVDRSMERTEYSDERVGKSAGEKYDLDVEAALAGLVVSLGAPAVQKLRLSKAQLLASTTDAGFNVLQLACMSHRSAVDSVATLVIGQREERLALVVYLLAQIGRHLATVFSNVSLDGTTVLHAATLLLEGVSQSVPANPKSRVGPRYGSTELELLSILWELGVAPTGTCATPVPSRGLTAHWTVLHGAISGGNVELVKTLISKGCSMEDGSGSYAAFLAGVPNLDSTTADAVVEACAASENYAELLNQSGALVRAVRAGNASAVTALLKSPKVDANAIDTETGVSAFAEACSTGGAESPVVAAFGGAFSRLDLLAEDASGSTCIDAALAAKDTALLQLFLANRENDVIERIIRLPGEGKPSLLEACESECITLVNKIGIAEPIPAPTEKELAAVAEAAAAAAAVAEEVEVEGEATVEAEVEPEPYVPTPEDEDAAAASEAVLAVILPAVNRKNIISADSHVHTTFATDVSYRAFCEAAIAAATADNELPPDEMEDEAPTDDGTAANE